MRQSEIAGCRPANSERLLLLRELPKKPEAALSNFPAPPVLNPDRGTDYDLLYPKGSSLHCLAGLEYLEEHLLKPDSPTRRVIATCCNSALFLDFSKGHWLTLYAATPSARALIALKCGS